MNPKSRRFQSMIEHVFMRISVKLALPLHPFAFTEYILNLRDNTYIYHLNITYFPHMHISLSVAILRTLLNARL